MSEGPVRHCPGCGQALRFPAGIGGMLMACPECGHRFASPFRLAEPAPAVQASNASPPLASLASLQESPQPAASLKQIPQNSLAARVAALYAAKSR